MALKFPQSFLLSGTPISLTIADQRHPPNSTPKLPPRTDCTRKLWRVQIGARSLPRFEPNKGTIAAGPWKDLTDTPSKRLAPHGQTVEDFEAHESS
jgi:hypothetical protein